MEISTVYSLLQIIDNPRQDVPLIAVLRSPLLGFTPDLLAAIRSCGKGDFYDACCACPEKPVQDFLAQLQQLRDLAAELPADQLLWQIYDRLHLLGVFGAMEDGELRRSRLLNLCRYASDLAGQGKITVFELTDYLRSLMTREKEPQIASEQNAGGVQIMSIHRSKGLEYPVVILCDLNHRFNGADQTSPVLVHPRLGLGTERVDTVRRVRYPHHFKDRAGTGDGKGNALRGDAPALCGYDPRQGKTDFSGLPEECPLPCAEALSPHGAAGAAPDSTQRQDHG